MDYQFSAGNGGERAGPGYLDDSALLAQARSGDQRALEKLYQRNWRPVYRSFVRYTKDPAEAEDLTQEVFLRAFLALPQYADRGVPYLAYLLRIATNLARDRWRAGPLRVVPVGNVPDWPPLGQARMAWPSRATGAPPCCVRSTGSDPTSRRCSGSASWRAGAPRKWAP